MRGEIRGVLLDLDGTLIDTEPLSTEAINIGLQGIEPGIGSVTQEMKNDIIGMKGIDWATIILSKCVL